MKEALVCDLGIDVTIVDFQQSAKAPDKMLLLISLVTSKAMLIGDTLTNLAGMSSTPIAS